MDLVLAELGAAVALAPLPGTFVLTLVDGISLFAELGMAVDERLFRAGFVPSGEFVEE